MLYVFKGANLEKNRAMRDFLQQPSRQQKFIVSIRVWASPKILAHLVGPIMRRV
ncbi:MAG: hypothetical protein ACJA1F_000830 [Paracoccaceae bacterium]|jgi:hypothetical protein|tara:strand:+ start:831 stop:992 length:162 start_codon:yes stop_codon:yes gene_type:complete